MKKNLFITILLIVPILLFGQSRKNTITLERNEKILQTVDLKTNGLVIKTGKNYMNSKKLNWKLRYYTSDLKLLWDIPIEKTQINKGFINPIIPSSTGKYIYHLEAKGYNATFGASKYNITQINTEGKVKKFELEDIKDYGSLKYIIANDSYLFFISNEDLHRENEKEDIFLNRISAKDFTYKKIKLEFPEVKDRDKNSFWTYSGHSNQLIYFSKKQINELDGGNIEVIAVNVDGKITKSFSIDIRLAKGSILPSRNLKNHYGAVQFNDIDYEATEILRSDGYETSYYARMEAYCNITICPITERIYIYGLYGFYKKSSVDFYEGDFIYLYDLNGELISKSQNKDKVIYEKSHYYDDFDRIVTFTINPDSTFVLQTVFPNKLSERRFLANGELESSIYKKVSLYNRVIFPKTIQFPKQGSTVQKYITSSYARDKKTHFEYFKNKNGSILLEQRSKTPQLNILYFENK